MCPNDPRFPQIAYRRGAARWPTPVLRATGIRVQTIVVAVRKWGMSTDDVAEDYDLARSQVLEALAFYESYRAELDALMTAEQELEQACA